MIELLVATCYASLPRLVPVLECFSRQGRLTWLRAGMSSESPSFPNVQMVTRIADLSVGNHLILLVAPPNEPAADLGPSGQVLQVLERHSSAGYGVEKALVVDSFAQLELLVTLPSFPGLTRLLQSRDWTVGDYRAAVLSRYSSALGTLQTRRCAAVFGAQRLGEEVCGSLRRSGVSIAAFIDNDVRKHGASIDGIPVRSLSALTDKDLPIVIATTRYTSSITRQLEGDGFRHILPYSVMSLVDAERYPDEIPYVGIQEDLASHVSNYLGLFLSLSDDKSRYVLDGLIRYRLEYDSRLADAVADEYTRQYFDAELIRFDGKDVFVDLGGYDGDTAEKFIEYSGGSYAKIYLFEPDRNLLRRAADRLRGHNAIEFVPAGAYSIDGELRFAASGGTNGAISGVGELVVPVRRLDSVVVEAPTLIKMDIEGAEMEALRGAANLLRTARPKLAIAAYHYASDLWRLVDVVREINPAYQFYLRHYSETGLESVIYAI